MNEMTLAGRVNPARALTRHEPLTDAISAAQKSDKHPPGGIKAPLERSHPQQEANV